jgi:hypothetical protein
MLLNDFPAGPGFMEECRYPDFGIICPFRFAHYIDVAILIDQEHLIHRFYRDLPVSHFRFTDNFLHLTFKECYAFGLIVGDLTFRGADHFKIVVKRGCKGVDITNLVTVPVQVINLSRFFNLMFG